MFASILRALRRFFGLEAAAPPAPVDDDDLPSTHHWWIPKDRRALQAAQLAARRKVLIERLARAKARQDATEISAVEAALARTVVAEPSAVAQVEDEPLETPPLGADELSEAEAMATEGGDRTLDLDLAEFASLDEVASILEDMRRNKDDEERRVESIELPQAMMMDDREYAIAKDWMADHRKAHPLPKTDVYGQYWVRFGRSSAGDTVSIGCTTCGTSKVLTDFSTLAENVQVSS